VAVRLPRGTDLTTQTGLAAVVGPIDRVTVEPLRTTGFSGSRHDRIRVALADGRDEAFVLKRTDPAVDWICVLYGALRARELALLESAELDGVWSVLACPYVAFTESDRGEASLLMRDLTSALLPDVRAPLSRGDEDLLLRSLARLHALFWARPRPASWLASSGTYCSLLSAGRPGGPDVEHLLPASLHSTILTGWREVFRRVPPGVAHLLRRPVHELEREWTDLPHTIVHGDAKVANFAILPEGRVAAFDWALVGWAPPSIDVGWYLAVNASRLADGPDAALATYRTFLEGELGRSVVRDEWRRLEGCAVVVGAHMLLWSKANALANEREGARAEWSWWMERLSAL
jgi:hypothetical protein